MKLTFIELPHIEYDSMKHGELLRPPTPDEIAQWEAHPELKSGNPFLNPVLGEPWPKTRPPKPGEPR